MEISDRLYTTYTAYDTQATTAYHQMATYFALYGTVFGLYVYLLLSLMDPPAIFVRLFRKLRLNLHEKFTRGRAWPKLKVITLWN